MTQHHSSAEPTFDDMMRDWEYFKVSAMNPEENKQSLAERRERNPDVRAVNFGTQIDCETRKEYTNSLRYCYWHQHYSTSGGYCFKGRDCPFIHQHHPNVPKPALSDKPSEKGILHTSTAAIQHTDGSIVGL
mgnify:CR=1 FL=1